MQHTTLQYNLKKQRHALHTVSLSGFFLKCLQGAWGRCSEWHGYTRRKLPGVAEPTHLLPFTSADSLRSITFSPLNHFRLFHSI